MHGMGCVLAHLFHLLLRLLGRYRRLLRLCRQPFLLGHQLAELGFGRALLLLLLVASGGGASS